jgi:transcriptional regulator with XRE-family HTH domain
MYKLLLELCKKKGISITSLCLEITGSSGNLNTWKKGNINPMALSKIADYFQVSTDYLLGRETLNNTDTQNLTESEKDMLDNFRQLTPHQQCKLIVRAEDMIEENQKVNSKDNYIVEMVASDGNPVKTITRETVQKILNAPNVEDDEL